MLVELELITTLGLVRKKIMPSKEDRYEYTIFNNSKNDDYDDDIAVNDDNIFLL